MAEISNQERREIAQRLRESDDWNNSTRALWSALDVRPDIVETTLSYEYLEHNGKKLFNRLADLIDHPLVEPRRYEAAFGEMLYCGSCGVPIIHSDCYCPHCGVEIEK